MGLAAGKGVVVAMSKDEAFEAIDMMRPTTSSATPARAW